MRTLILGVLLLGATAHGEEAVSREDDLRLQVAALQAQIAKLSSDLSTCQVQRKYGLADGDSYDRITLAIKRAAKPEAKPKPVSK